MTNYYDGYLYETVSECIVAGEHLYDVDDDGYCNRCGYQNAETDSLGYDDDYEWINLHECPTCLKMMYKEDLYKHVKKCSR